MDLYECIKQDYQQAVALQCTDQDLKTALKYTDRVPSFLENLAKELSKTPKPVSRETIKNVTYSLTNVFLACVQQRAKEMAQSDLERQAQLAMQQKKQDHENLADKLAKGESIDVQEIQDLIDK